MTVLGSRVNRNSADGTAGSGGGILNNAGDPRRTPHPMLRNDAQRAGGGIEANAGHDRDQRVHPRGEHHRSGPRQRRWSPPHRCRQRRRRAAPTCSATPRPPRAAACGTPPPAPSPCTAPSVYGNIASGNDCRPGRWRPVQRRRVADGRPDPTSAATRRTARPAPAAASSTTSAPSTVDESTISDNSAQRAGGGIEANIGTSTVERSTLNANTAGASPGNGGGVHVTGAGVFDVSKSRVIGNVASAEGGGLWNSATGTFTVDQTRIAENVANGTARGPGRWRHLQRWRNADRDKLRRSMPTRLPPGPARAAASSTTPAPCP